MCTPCRLMKWKVSVQLHNNVQLLELESALQSEKSVGLEAQKGAGVLYKKKGGGVYYNFKQSLVVPTSIQTVTDPVPKTKTPRGREKLKAVSHLQDAAPLLLQPV